MIVENQKVKMKWNSKNKKWYEEKGYKYTKMRDEFEVIVDDLPKNSDRLVRFICDYCKNEFERKWVYYNRNIERSNTVLKDCCECEDCKQEKIKESNLINYGVESTAMLDSSKEKTKTTNIEKYGVEYYFQTDEYKEKYKNTCIEKYGVINVFQLDEIKEKSLTTNIQKYGVENYAKTKECRDKMKQTCLDKYGVDNYSKTDEYKEKYKNTMNTKYGVNTPLESKEIMESMKAKLIEKYGVDSVSKIENVKIKKAETYYKNGTIATSNQQRYIWKLIGGELNYSNNTPSLDIAFPEEKIYVEVNGSGHNLPVKTGWMEEEMFHNKERRRYFYLKREGWKGIFINTPCDYLPSDDVIVSEIEMAKEWFEINNYGHSHYIINIGKVINDINYGKLRRIKKEDLDKFEEAI